METASVPLGSTTVHLIGVCQGLDGEAEAAVEAIERKQPAVVALALGPEMADNVDEIVGAEALGAEDEAYMRGLSEWGSVTLPAPTFPAVVDAAERVDARVEGVDMPEAEYLEHHLDRVGMKALLKRALRVRWLGWRPPDADSPSAYCRAFDAHVNEGPFGRLQHDREESMAANLAAIADEGPIACVLEIERLDGVKRALRARDRSAP